MSAAPPEALGPIRSTRRRSSGDTGREHAYDRVMSTATRATDLLRLLQDPALLTVVNVWDAISAFVVADVPGTTALATASHSIAATLGYEDGEQIPVQEMLDMCRRIVEAVDLPVSADLEAGYGDAPDTIRRAIGVGVVGANIEDQMKPLTRAADQVEAVVAAAAGEGVPDFVLNARTDAFLTAGDRDPACLYYWRGNT